MSTRTKQKASENLDDNKAHGMIYRNLDSEREEIRVLNLYPAAEESDEIYCTLSHAELNPLDGTALPIYEALSYVWGEPVFSEPIRLNEKLFFITPSLKYALLCLRLKAQVRVLWVDAICINQSDIKERNQQVALMRQIYSQCKKDIAWLDPVVGKGLQLQDLYSDPELHKKECEIRKGMELIHNITHKNATTLKQLQREWFDDGYLLEGDTEGSLRALFDSPTLWERLWVMQELSLAPRVTIMCRNAELSWDSLSVLLRDEPYFDAFHMYRSHADYFPDWSDMFVRIKLIEDQRRLFSQSTPVQSRLLDVLTRFREMKSTDPRDNIYGLLGLVAENHGIKIDYQKPVSDLYRETTMALINLSGNLDILCQNPFEGINGHMSLQQAAGGTQSWTCEFDKSHEDCSPIIFAQRGIFNAGASHCRTPVHLLGPSMNIMAVRGSILGTVKPILEDRGQDNHPEHIVKLYLGDDIFLSHNKHLYSPYFKGRTTTSGEISLRAFWRTLVKDCTLPPRMRRLREDEIEFLDKTNFEVLGQEDGPNVYTIRIDDSKHNSISVYSYSLGEGFYFRDFNHGYLKARVGSKFRSYTTSHFMFVMTENGLFLLARPHVQQGDIVAILDGGKVPMVLRKTGQTEINEEIKDVYKVVCPAYVHGFMDGEAEVGVTEGWLEKHDIFLV